MSKIIPSSKIVEVYWDKNNGFSFRKYQIDGIRLTARRNYLGQFVFTLKELEDGLTKSLKYSKDKYPYIVSCIFKNDKELKKVEEVICEKLLKKNGGIIYD